MGNDIDKLFEDEAFRAIEPERLELFKNFYIRIQGKSGNQILEEVIKFNASLPKGNQINKAEKQAIIGAVMNTMPAKEQAKFNNMLKMIEGFMN